LTHERHPGCSCSSPSQMPRRGLQHSNGLVFHVMNRSVRRVRIFCDPRDYGAFEKLLTETLGLIPIRLLAFCLMPNHWHMVLWPVADELPRFMHRLTLTHAKRWHKAHGSERTGPLYQNRYTAVPVQAETHLLTVLRYVERNALRAGLVSSAEQWRWSSLWHRTARSHEVPLADWPIAMPPNWVSHVNEPQTAGELQSVRASVSHNWPLGERGWRDATARRLGISLRGRGRPVKKPGLIFPEAPGKN
jgi:putative transposase